MGNEFLINMMAFAVSFTCMCTILKYIVRAAVNVFKAEMYDEILKDDKEDSEKNL